MTHVHVHRERSGEPQKANQAYLRVLELLGMKASRLISASGYASWTSPELRDEIGQHYGDDDRLPNDRLPQPGSAR